MKEEMVSAEFEDAFDPVPRFNPAKSPQFQATSASKKASTPSHPPETRSLQKSQSIQQRKEPRSYQEAVLHAVRGGLRSFALGYGLRSGVLVLLKILQLLRKSPRNRRFSIGDLCWQTLLSRDSLQYGLATGTFAFNWKLMLHVMRIYRQKSDRLNSAVGGALAGLSLLFLPKDTRCTFSVQMLLRALQLLYNYHKAQNNFQIPHGSALLFSLCGSQIMYAYLMNPTSMPKSYYLWIKNLAGVHESVLGLNRKVVRQDGVYTGHSDDLIELAKMIGATDHVVDLLTERLIDNAVLTVGAEKGSFKFMVPCELIHPRCSGCRLQFFLMLLRVFKAMMPVNLALCFVPPLFLKLNDTIKDPLTYFKRSLLEAGRSSLFLAVFCSVFQGLFCIPRQVPNISILHQFLSSEISQRSWFYFSGFMCSLASIYVANPKKRSELALYVFPKAAESLYLTVLARKWSVGLPRHADTVAGVAAFSILMGYFQTDPECLNPMVRVVISKLIGKN